MTTIYYRIWFHNAEDAECFMDDYPHAEMDGEKCILVSDVVYDGPISTKWIETYGPIDWESYAEATDWATGEQIVC